jgi:K+-sensing histidine kinase KdpD
MTLNSPISPRAAAETDDSPTNLALAYQRLLALERFKSGFLARTAHELRSPVNTIVSLHQLILEDLCEGPEEEKEFIHQSKTAALKMLALFDQITAVAKLDVGREPPKLEAVDLSLLLPEVEMLTTLQAANQNVRYSSDIPVDELEVYTDGKWLKNILISLEQDAIPYTKQLRLAVEETAETVEIVIECDRAAAVLQAELNSVSDDVALLEAAAVQQQTDDSSIDQPSAKLATAAQIDNLRLSTGLILATAQTALPLIKGSFSIEPHPDADARSCLRCRFPRL